MNQPRSAGTGLSLALLSAVTFASSGTFARSLIEAGWSAEAAVAARIGIAALVLAVPAAFSLRGKLHLLRRNLGLIGWFGLLAVAGAQACFFNAVRYLPIGVALLLEYLGIILVVGWMWAVHGHRPRRLTFLGSVAAVVGGILVVYAIGVPVLAWRTDLDLWTAIRLGGVIFLPGDLIKAGLAALIATGVHRAYPRLSREDVPEAAAGHT